MHLHAEISFPLVSPFIPNDATDEIGAGELRDHLSPHHHRGSHVTKARSEERPFTRAQSTH